MPPASCTRCRQHKEYGHRDVDSLYWYCEDCWLTFCGRRRRCALCRALKDEGHVDQVLDYWYCLPCWDRRTAPAPPGYSPYWPPPGGYAAPPGYPPPGGYPPPLHPYPPPLGGPGYGRRSASGSRSRSRSRSRGKGARKRNASAAGFKKEFKPYHATSVPKDTDLAANATADEPPTTAMLRNIPSKFTQQSLLEEIDAEGFNGLYDFFYLPMDVRNKTNVGYAFVNFLEPDDMARFSRHFEGYRFKNNNSQKIATVSPAHVQGLKRNIQQLSKKAVLHFNKGQYKPVVFRNGERVDFEVMAKELD
ncbi:ML2 [Symbiodinium sp. CCMP2592]|nr:ML2 [Symbiodinium sp. CCMP2592]